MKKIYGLIIIFALLFASAAISSASKIERGVADAALEENHPDLVEAARIRIKNERNGRIEVSRDRGASWQKIGRVVYPCVSLSRQGYTASQWVPDGFVAATAVNAIHIKTDYSTEEEKGVLFSVVPKNMMRPPSYYNSYLSPDSSIYTDIEAGKGIFGGESSPLVGNQVSTSDANGNLYPLTPDYKPEISDSIVIIIDRPKKYPGEIVFENRFGGLITLKYPDGRTKLIGEVLKPVIGVGRFQGTSFAGVGRIRANHSAVICVSTSPIGKIGGFQIIPAGHGMSKEMISARMQSQWLVAGPPSVFDPSPEGSAPLYKYFIRPVYDESDLDADNWKEKLLQRFIVEVKFKEDDAWRAMPEISLNPDLTKPLPHFANKALDDVSHIRILFPVY